MPKNLDSNLIRVRVEREEWKKSVFITFFYRLHSVYIWKGEIPYLSTLNTTYCYFYFIGGPCRDRTYDLLIKSQLLYQLS